MFFHNCVFFFLYPPPSDSIHSLHKQPTARIIIQRLVYFGHRIRSSTYASDRPYPLLFLQPTLGKIKPSKNHQKKTKVPSSTGPIYRRLELYCDLLIFLFFFLSTCHRRTTIATFRALPATQPNSRETLPSRRTVRADPQQKRTRVSSIPLHSVWQSRA